MKKDLNYWLDLAQSHGFLTEDECNNIKDYIENAPDDIIRENEFSDIIAVFNKFYWDDSKEGYEYWEEKVSNIAHDYKYQVLLLLLLLNNTYNDSKNIVYNANKFFKANNIDNDTVNDTVNDTDNYSAALLYEIKHRNIYELIHRISTKFNDVFAIKIIIKAINNFAIIDDKFMYND